MRLQHRHLVLAIGLGLASTLACAPPAQRRYESDLSRTPAAAQHAIHNERLVELMGSLDALMRERLPQSMDLRSGRALRVEGIAAVADSLADSAGRIAETVDSFELNEDERYEFLQLADQLRVRALELGASDSSTTSLQLHQRIASIRTTCDQCHARFRLGVPPLPIP